MSTTNKRGASIIPQAEHVQSANAKKVMDSILVPGTVLTDDISAAPVKVGKGNLLRIRVTALTYIAFDDAPDSDLMSNEIDEESSPALELFEAGTYLVTATGTFVRASADAARIEIIEA